MNRIVVIGPPGAGKTEFANELGAVLGTPNVFHLDHYFWKPGWTRTSSEERHLIIETLTQHDTWIIEGNFLETVDEQISHADTVIWLNLSLWISLYRVLKRYFNYIGRERPLIAPGCRDKITFRFLWSIFVYQYIDAKIIKRKFINRKTPSLIVLKNPEMVATYLRAVKTGSTSK